MLCLRKGRTTLDRESWFCLNARLCGTGGLPCLGNGDAGRFPGWDSLPRQRPATHVRAHLLGFDIPMRFAVGTDYSFRGMAVWPEFCAGAAEQVLSKCFRGARPTW